MQQITISVIGARACNLKTAKLAQNVGKVVAECGAVLVCGGLGGVMEAAAKGAKEAGGLTIGLLPGNAKSDANPYIDIALPTTIGFARNVMVAAASHIVVALPGSYGTESEICYALVYGRPVIDLGGWGIKGMQKAKNVEGLRRIIKKLLSKV